LISTVGSNTNFIPDKYWGISNVGYGAYMWQVTNIKTGWKTGGGNATKLRCSTKTATGSGVQATIDVNIEPEQ